MFRARCCVSKARAPAAPVAWEAEDDELNGDPQAALRAELGAMTLGVLKKRAREMGVVPELIDEADDTDDAETSKRAVVELILSQARDREPESDDDGI